MQAVAKPGPRAFLDMLHPHAAVWQAFALWRLGKECGLKLAEETGGCPVEGSAGEVPHATVGGGAATITQCTGADILQVCLFLARVLLDCGAHFCSI